MTKVFASLHNDFKKEILSNFTRGEDYLQKAKFRLLKRIRGSRHLFSKIIKEIRSKLCSTCSKQETHWPSLLFGVIVLIVVVILFATLALGAYFVYNGEISNVVANTYGSGSSQPILSVSAVGLSTEVQRTVWVDPQINANSNGTLSVSPGSGFIIANATTDSNGNLIRNFTLSNSLLDKYSVDGRSVHSVWIVGLNATNAANPIPLSIDSEQNYSVGNTSQRNHFLCNSVHFRSSGSVQFRNSVHSIVDESCPAFCNGCKRPLQKHYRSIETNFQTRVTGSLLKFGTRNGCSLYYCTLGSR